MNEEDNLSEEGLEDPYEKELRKALDEQKKRINKKKDDLTEGKIKKKYEAEEEEDGDSFLDPESGFRTTLAIGTEVGLNTILDLFSMDPTQISQVLGAQAINYLAQRIRGGEFSQGEMVASGLASLIPGAAQAKSISGGIARTVGRGAVSGALETGAADLIDTGEIDSERVAQGAVIGGAFGGIFGTAASQPSTKRFVERFQKRLNGEKYVKLTPEEARGLGLGEPMMSFSGPTGSGPIGKITYRNIPNLDSFLSGQTTSLNRTTAGLIQNPNFKLGDFLQGIDQELERVRRKYPNIDVDTNLQRFKWQWHHINPDKMPVDFYVGLNNVSDRDLITDTLLRETNVSAGMNPSNRIGLPTEVHDEITDWLDTEIGKRSEVITQKISDDLGYGLTLTGRGSRAAKLQFNQRFASEPVQTRIPYIVEYGEKIAESSEILTELMNQFDIFYDIPNGFRLDVDVNTMERMLARLDEGKPTIPTLREIISEVTDGMRIPVTNNLGVQSIAVPRDPNLIRAIDIEGMLRDHKAGQSVLDNKEIRSLGKELNQIYQMDLDIKGASTSAYIRNWYNERFGGTRRSGTKTGPN